MIKKVFYHSALGAIVFSYIFSAIAFGNVSINSIVTQNTTTTPYTSQCNTTYRYALYEGQSFYLYHTHTPGDLGSTRQYFSPSNVVTYNYSNVIGNSISGNNIGGKFTDFKYKSNGRLGTNKFSNIGGGIQTTLAWEQENYNRAIKPNPNPNRANLVGQVVHILNRKQVKTRGGSSFSMTTHNFSTNNVYTRNANPNNYYSTSQDKKCQNFYIAKCGDGVRDDINKPGGSNTNGKQGIQTNNGFVERVFPSTVIFEECDGTDGIVPGYTCNAECKLVPIAPPQMADLSVTKVVNNPTPIVGTNVTFTMVLNNAGPNNAGGVTLLDLLPSGYTYVSHSAHAGTTYNPSNGIRNVGTINVGQNKTLTITAQVNATGNYLNTIEVMTSDKPDPDSTPGNGDPTEDDRASAYVTPIFPAPTCTLTVNPSNIISGGLATVSWNINGAFVVPTYIYVTPQVPGTWPHTVNTPTGTTYVSPNQVGTYTFSMTVMNIHGQQSTCSAVLNVGLPQMADLSVTKVVNNPTPIVGTNVTFTMVLNNAGPNNAGGVTLLDLLPSGYTYVSHSAHAGTTYNPSNGIRNVGTINVGQNKTLTITAQVNATGNYLNTIEVMTSDKPDPNSTPGNGDPTEDDRASAYVTPIFPAPTCTLTVNPSNIISGGLATVSWNINGAFVVPTYIYVTPQVPGAWPHTVNTPTGTSYVSPNQVGTYTFSMTVMNIHGQQSTCSAVLNVSPAPVQVPILTIQKTVLQNNIYYSGDQIGFRIKFQNIGSGTANDVVLTDILPSSLTYLTSTILGISNASFSLNTFGANHIVTYSGFNLSPGQSGYLIITGLLITNYAQNNRTNYSDIYSNNHGLVHSIAQFLVGTIPNNIVVFTKSSNKSEFQLGENIQFTITATNQGPAPITNLLITDIRPNQSCINYLNRSSNNGFSQSGSMSRYRPGTLAVGQTVSLILNGKISNNPSCAANYNNIANLNYLVLGESQSKTANFPFKVLVGYQCEELIPLNGTVILINNNQANAQFRCESANGLAGNISIHCGNGQTLNGYGSSYTATCNYGNNPGTYNAICYVENQTSPACSKTIMVDKGMLGYCGNGIIEGFETCDLGGTYRQRQQGIPIYNYLDLNGFPAGIYANAGYKCQNCAIKKAGYYEAPACNGISTTLSVQKGEILPFRWELEGNNIVDKASCQTASDGDILKNSLKCTFKVFNGNNSNQFDDDYTYKVVKNCDVNEWAGHIMFDYFENLKWTIFPSLQNPFGKYYFVVNNFLEEGTYGEYKLVLDKVEYKYCNSNLEDVGTAVDRICEVNFTLTKPYLMQKSLFGATPKATTDINLDQFYDMQLQKIINKTDLYSIMKVDADSYAGGVQMDKQISDFINKYDKLSINIPINNLNSISQGNITQAKKLPGKQIYIIRGTGILTLKQLDSFFSKPFTMIISGMDLLVEGSLKTYGMFLVKGGKISFKEDPANRCKATQVIQGIFISDKGFGVGDVTLNIINNLNRPRCNRGGLNVKGVLIGRDIDKLVIQRRSQLNDWFFVNSSDPAKIKIERRNKIFSGASLMIEYSPGLRGNLPPGAEDFTKALEVYRR